MDVKNIIKEKLVTITNQGMITIPAFLRKMHNLKDGDKILIVEDEGTLKMIPIKELEEIQKGSYSTKEMLDQMEKTKKAEIRREL
ncbi:MAG: AbrB/MazE/SpoVT family DNA-binding domain-containing protein [Candidatus Lokiarchaeota archaeon]|nr:AbrB/MazE/SpoVT family DNA-binding domain-containing protein [Candidatus Lokiarchaeota archaeon]